MKMNEIDQSVKQDVAEGLNDTIYPNAEVIKSRNGKPVGEIYQDENGWGCFHYKADNGADGMSDREEALAQLKDMHNERRPQGVAEVAGAQKCWPGYRKTGTQPGTGKNAGKRVNDCEKIKEDEVDEAAKHGLYYNVNKRKAAGTSRPASSPKAPTAQAWKDAAKTAKKEGVDDNRTGFSRPPREMDEANLMYRYDTGDGKVKQRMIDNHDEKSAHREGFRDSIESALKMHGIIRSKFDPKKWVQKQGDKWLQVFPFGNPKDVSEGGAQQAAIAIAKRESGKYTKDGKRIKESATVGATSAANIASVANPTQAHSKKPVKSVNALDQDEVSLFGAPMETVKNTAGKKAAIIKRR